MTEPRTIDTTWGAISERDTVVAPDGSHWRLLGLLPAVLGKLHVTMQNIATSETAKGEPEPFRAVRILDRMTPAAESVNLPVDELARAAVAEAFPESFPPPTHPCKDCEEMACAVEMSRRDVERLMGKLEARVRELERRFEGGV